jgi:ABC-2 type transport system permease protein
MNWRIVWAIARKDIVDALKNGYLLFALLLPIGISLLFNVTMLRPGADIITVAVYDPGGSRLAAGLREAPTVKLVEVDSEEALVEAVKREAVGGIEVPAGFDAAVAAGEQPELPVYLSHRRGGGSAIAFQELLRTQLWGLVGQQFPARIVSTDVETPLGQDSAAGFRIDLYLFILILVMALAMAGVFVVPTLLVEEKEKHTLQALLLSPAGPAEVTAGKAVTGMVYSLLGAGVLIVLNQGWEGAWPLTVLFTFVGALSAVTVGLLMGSLFRTTMQVNVWSTLVMVLMMMPSWLAVMALPAPFEVAMRLTPTYYLVDGLSLSLAGKLAWGQLGVDLAVLVGSTLLLLALIVWILRREERGEALLPLRSRG